jgi:hypothetical protein
MQVTGSWKEFQYAQIICGLNQGAPVQLFDQQSQSIIKGEKSTALRVFTMKRFIDSCWDAFELRNWTSKPQHHQQPVRPKPLCWMDHEGGIDEHL